MMRRRTAKRSWGVESRGKEDSLDLNAESGRSKSSRGGPISATSPASITITRSAKGRDEASVEFQREIGLRVGELTIESDGRESMSDGDEGLIGELGSDGVLTERTSRRKNERVSLGSRTRWE